MTRTYTPKRRAEQQAETRLRLVEAAIELHSRIGPAATTLSMVAARAGVQRHTLYAHFPDQRSLQMACSGLALARSPLPDAAPWAAILAPAPRLRRGLAQLYRWYADNADLAACVVRDAETDPLTREIIDLRITPSMAAYHAVLGRGLTRRQRAMLHLAMQFASWRALVRDGGLKSAEAVDAMVQAIAASRSARTRFSTNC
jgi:AcrR family transcriptional regulator